MAVSIADEGNDILALTAPDTSSLKEAMLEGARAAGRVDEQTGKIVERVARVVKPLAEGFFNLDFVKRATAIRAKLSKMGVTDFEYERLSYAWMNGIHKNLGKQTFDLDSFADPGARILSHFKDMMFLLRAKHRGDFIGHSFQAEVMTVAINGTEYAVVMVHRYDEPENVYIRFANPEHSDEQLIGELLAKNGLQEALKELFPIGENGIRRGIDYSKIS